MNISPSVCYQKDQKDQPEKATFYSATGTDSELTIPFSNKLSLRKISEFQKRCQYYKILFHEETQLMV